MKKYLNTSIVLILLIIFGIFYLNYSSLNKVKISEDYKDLGKSKDPDAIEILNPKFKNKGLNMSPYEISAKKGIQIGENIELYSIDAKFTDENNKLININADKGFYNQKDQVIHLIGNILMYDTFDSKIMTEKATIEIVNKKIFLLDKVISTSDTSIIESNSSIVDDINKTITYIGNVKVKIVNK
ncbi:LPS export ABC transporter periplasmic protein LptC [Pelagibacterales bacterium]|nr:LPS export ABC transporter periplasmic protein LptC [Pelagibacterales bacterium]